MGNCCGYIRFHTAVPVTDPSTINDLNKKCEYEIKNTTIQKQKEHIILTEPIKQSDINPEITIKIKLQDNEETSNESKTKLKIINVDDKNLHKDNNTKLEVNNSQMPLIKLDSKKNINLFPNPNIDAKRRDSRSITSINSPTRKKDKEGEIDQNAIKKEDIKLDDKLIDKLKKFDHFIKRNPSKKSSKHIIGRSSSQDNEGWELSEDNKDEEEEINRTKEEINTQLKETKNEIDEKQKKITIIKINKENNKKTNQHLEVNGKEKSPKKKEKKKVKEMEEILPGKGLLKKYKTIGDEKKKKGKKKVKFQDLADKKKKKKDKGKKN